MKRVFCRLLALFFLVSGIIFAQKKSADFNGTWLFEKNKSEMPASRRGRAMAMVKIIVKQEQNKLTVESFHLNREGKEDSSSASYTLEGKECENGSKNRHSVSTAEWADDGRTLEIFTETHMSRGDREFTMESEAFWSIIDGMLCQKITRSTPMGDRTVKLFYKKAADK